MELEDLMRRERRYWLRIDELVDKIYVDKNCPELGEDFRRLKFLLRKVKNTDDYEFHFNELCIENNQGNVQKLKTENTQKKLLKPGLEIPRVESLMSTWVSTVSDSVTHTHGFLGSITLTWLILTHFENCSTHAHSYSLTLFFEWTHNFLLMLWAWVSQKIRVIFAVFSPSFAEFFRQDSPRFARLLIF